MWTLPAEAEPVINEFMASNRSVYPDNSDFDDYSDWIELANPTATDVSLANCYLTDDLTLPLKWRFPDGASIPAHGFLTIRADGFNAGPGETYVRGYYPWDSTFVTRNYHASFKLSADGEEIGLYRIDTPPVDATLIPKGADWLYHDDGTDPGADWVLLSYDDAGWASGAAELGYGDGDESTVVGYGLDADNKYPTTHFRKHFTIVNPALVGDVRLSLLIDDSAVVYLNGEEISRIRMPDGVVSYQDYSGRTVSNEGEFEPIDVTASQLRAGDNVLAVEVHQASGDSSDISFDAELIVTEITGTPSLIDSVEFGPQVTDVSYGRDPVSPGVWSFFAEATPEGANTSEALTVFEAASAITASLDSGFYAGTQTVALTGAEPGETIRYTLDGSIPSTGSAFYTNELAIGTTTVLRARSFASGKLPGPLLTRSYLLDADAQSTLPVFSMVADPATLFDDAIGIYENDTAYPYKGREVPIRLEMFEAYGTPAFAVNAGTRIAGENIWRKAQKPFNVYCRSKYGDDTINYQLFPGQPVATFGEFMLRNGGDDWEETMLRDALLPGLLEGRANVSLYSYRPAVLYLNGAFWGIYNIRKRFDEVYFANEHQFVEGTYDFVAYAHDPTGTTTLMAEAGSTDTYEEFLTFLATNDTADASVYAEIGQRMDIDSFIDYVVTTDFAVNTSWSHNREFWRSHAPGSRWTWVANDLDRGLDMANVTGSLIDDFRSSYTLFRRLDDNTDFVNRLLQRYAAHLGSTFHPDRIADVVDEMAAEVEAEVARHRARWSGSMTTRQAQLDEIKTFAADRPSYAVSRLQLELLGSSTALGQADLTVEVSPAHSGQVYLAGVPMAPEYTHTVAMFRNIPFELTAEAAPGYTFAGWSNGSTDPTIEMTPADAETVTATFVPGAETVLPGIISTNTTLIAAESPYSLDGDLVVRTGGTLTIDAGVQLRMPPRAHIIVNGILRAHGTESNPIEFVARGAQPWGNIGFVNASAPSTLTHIIIRGASLSRHDPWNLKAAVSGYNSTIILDHVDIVANLPVFARFGSTTLQNCRIHIQFTGDGINVKSGDGWVENCTFTGNPTPDTDAIDFDNVLNGMIQGNRIYDFYGFNSDAIDVGEGCMDLMVANNRIFNITDKGVSVGQASVAYIERNLIVNCGMGVGVKDEGSTAHIDQSTFARNNVGVAAYEKNVGKGGGIAYIRNSIFSRSKDTPVIVDSLSTLTVNYSLCDTIALPGGNNLFADPLFNDAGAYDFSLAPSSPAVDAGDPTHAPDPDGSRADMGAYYGYSPDDYPFLSPDVLVVNEVLAHSTDTSPDWIELYNTSSQGLDVGGWYVSDDPDTPQKYRIALGTVIPGYGYLVLDEDRHFGSSSTDPGAMIPFALSKNGDTVHVFGPGNGLWPDYHQEETFGPSLRDVTYGRYYQASTGTYDFVALATSTPGAANSLPRVGPIVISEIMYHPPMPEAEYVELTNISTDEVTLFDIERDAPWRITKGFTYAFPSTDPVTMTPGERILLVHNTAAFLQTYDAPANTRIIQWDAGSLDNSGETLELSQPGDLNASGVRKYIREDRVHYAVESPWPTGPNGDGTALSRIDERAYGNDAANWMETDATPGTSNQ